MPITGPLYFWGKGAKNIPEKAGAYSLYNQEKKLIFIGGSSNLKKTFSNYLDSENFNEPEDETKYYKRELVNNWDERLKELFSEYKQIYEKSTKLIFNSKQTENDEDYGFGFYFYENADKPIWKVVLDLEELKKELKKMSVSQIEFH
jgi:hypothetical protein